MRKEKRFISVIQIISLLVSLPCVGICLFKQAAEGMELLFLLPLSFLTCCFLFPRVFTYIQDNIGLVVLFSSIVIRYLLTPVMLTITGEMLPTLRPSVSSFRYASIIMSIELIVVFILFDYIWTKHKKRINDLSFSDDKPANFRLSVTGLAFLLFLLLLFLLRGHASNVFSHLSTWFTRFKDFSELYTYDLIAFQVIKSIVVLTLVSFFAKAFHKTSGFGKWFFFVLACLVAALNTYLFMYDARAALAELFLSTMYMLISFFPKARGALSKMFGLTGVLFVVMVFAESTMEYTSNTVWDMSFASKLTNMTELYFSGPSVVAKTIDTYSFVRSNMSIDVVWSDLIHGINIFSTVPFLRPIYNTANTEITNSLFKMSIGSYPYMMPNYSFCTYYFSDLFGWLFEIPLLACLFKFLTKMDLAKKKYNDAMFYYAVTYIEVEIGMAFFSENVYLLIHVITGTTIWLVLFFYINRFGNRFKLRN